MSGQQSEIQEHGAEATDPHDRDQYGVCHRCDTCSDPSCCPQTTDCVAKR